MQLHEFFLRAGKNTISRWMTKLLQINLEKVTNRTTKKLWYLV